MFWVRMREFCSEEKLRVLVSFCCLVVSSECGVVLLVLFMHMCNVAARRAQLLFAAELINEGRAS